MPHTWFSLRTLRSLALPALSLTIGLQAIRLFFSSLAWYLRDTVGVASVQLGGIALAAFAGAFLAALLRRLLGPRLSLWIAVGGMALVRVGEQLTFDPAADLGLAFAGTALFGLFVPLWWGHLRAHGGPSAAERLSGGLVLGLALDGALRSLGGSLDLSWIPGLLPAAAVLAVSAACVWSLVKEPIPDASVPSEAGWADLLPAISFGPYLLLQLLVFQTSGWISEVGGLPAGWGAVWVGAGNLAAAAGLIVAFGRPYTIRPYTAALAGLFLVLAAGSAEWLGAPLLLTGLLAQFLFGWAWAPIAVASVMPQSRGLGRTALIAGASLVLFLLLGFIDYVALDLAMPFPRSAVAPIGAVLFALGLAAAAYRLARSEAHPSMDRTPVVPAALLAAVPLLMLVAPRPPAAVPPSELRVMNYNIHSAFRVEGQQDPEAIARVIEESGAGIVGLQEISRGWLINGSTDLVEWLARRLGMQVVFRGTADPIWGNALLTSYPILESGHGGLPQLDTLIRRGYLWARLDVGPGDPLTIVTTHLHQIEADSDVRLAQVPVLIEAWGGAPHSVILGDLNAEPGSLEMAMLAEAGLIDAWSVAGAGPGYTWRADAADQRIDWIWVTPDLLVTGFTIPQTTASDHLPIWVELEIR